MEDTNFTISLADGTRWCIRAGHPHAVDIVNALGATMRLQPGSTGREMLVKVGKKLKTPVNLSGPGPVVCILPPPINNDLLAIGMSQIGLAIGHEIQSRGGILIHGALITLPNISSNHVKTSQKSSGVLLAGSSGAGKTTASNRLPQPWQALSDDAALVVRDLAGQYWAHPWPTWSNFYSTKGQTGLGGSWDVQNAVPLRAVFFLSRSPSNCAEPLKVTAATAMLMEAVQHVSGILTRDLQDEEIQFLYKEQLTAVEAITQAVPAYTLHISLTGEFWKEIEKALKTDKIDPLSPDLHLIHPSFEIKERSTIDSLRGEDISYIVYSGPSMNPTLYEPDLLEVKPYENRAVLRGDVIFFNSPRDNTRVVHRVVGISPAGIRTRGDNNAQKDPYFLKTEEVIGQVVRAQRDSQRRRVAGGRIGTLVGYGCHVRRLTILGLSRLMHSIYSGLANTDLFQNLLPNRLKPRVFVFKSRNQYFLKLFMGNRVIGKYDLLKQQWNIRRPYRLLVNEAALPSPNRDYINNNKDTLFGLLLDE